MLSEAGPAPDPQERLAQIKAQLHEEWRLKAQGIHHDHLSDLAFLIVEVETREADLAAVRAVVAQQHEAGLQVIATNRELSDDLAAVRSQLEATKAESDQRLTTWAEAVERLRKAKADLTALRADYDYCKKERAAAREDANLQRQLHQELDSAHKRVKSELAALRAERDGYAHADKMMQADLSAFVTDCSTPTFQLVRNALEALAEARARLAVQEPK